MCAGFKSLKKQQIQDFDFVQGTDVCTSFVSQSQHYKKNGADVPSTHEYVCWTDGWVRLFDFGVVVSCRKIDCWFMYLHTLAIYYIHMYVSVHILAHF